MGEIAGDSLNQKAGSGDSRCGLQANDQRAETDKPLYDLGVILGLAYKNSKNKVDELATRNDI
jgi:hypothetical protein